MMGFGAGNEWLRQES